MEYDLNKISGLYIRPVFATLIILGYYAGLFNGTF